MPHPHQREVAVFEAALRLPPEQRQAYLEQTCAGDVDLLQRIQGLLKANENQTDFLAPVAPMVPLPLSEQPGDRIGPYKLLQQLGEGGCGVVYVAEQEQPIRRRVALKIIKQGMDTRQVIARFEAERQALALMDHPNIAKVHDAGATETGRPYFVMELVRGIKITDYCDEKKLPTRQRLELFVQVCQAVQHAHQKGVIHRDLKPSNILVTVNDGAAVAKVIDFGIAKATTGERLTDKTIFTAFEQFIGTPAYMSPEQAELTSADIDTRSDIYSLGVLLYELLTGHTPFDAGELLKAGLDAMRRTIREKEPARPSTRVSTLGANDQTTTAQRRGLEAQKLINLLKGDLDWIAIKCLEKDRARRYETANGLAMDVQRHLNNEPVVARPPSRWYELQKNIRRHKLGFAATAAVMASLLIGLAVSTWMFIRERQERAREDAIRSEAETARAKSAAGENLHLATVLYNLRKYSEAENLLDQIPPDLAQPDPLRASQRRKLGWWHGLNEEWTLAATNFAEAIRADDPANPNEITMDYLPNAVALMELADTSRYDNFRRRVIAENLQTTNPVIAERLCRIVLTLPADAGLTHAVDTLYETMKSGQDTAGLGPVAKDWGCLGLALIDYRRTNYKQAIEWCNRAWKVPIKDPGYQTTAHAICALAHHALGQETPARSELEAAREWIKEQPYSTTEAIWGLINGLYAEILLHEAAVQIEGGHPHDLGHGLRQYALGELYASGSFVNKDSAKALVCFIKSDDEGLDKVQYLVGRMYARGEGTPTNLVEAAHWFSRAATHTNAIIWVDFEQWGEASNMKIHGYVAAWIQLGLMCAHGRGVPEDAKQARSWFQKVADEWSDRAGDHLLLNELAWSLATAPDPNDRFGPAAVVLAEAAVRNCGAPDKSQFLDSLAAAHAEAGEFADAVRVEKEAIGLLSAKEAVDDCMTRLKLYESNTPYRETKP